SVKELRALSNEKTWRISPDKSLSAIVVGDEYEEINPQKFFELILSPFGCDSTTILSRYTAKKELENTSSDVFESADLVLLHLDSKGNQTVSGEISGIEEEYLGLELLEYIKKKYSDIPIVVITPHQDLSLYQQCKAIGVDGYVTKDWSDYQRYRLRNDEEAWYVEWIRTIENSLKYKSFREDIELRRDKG